MNALEEKHVRLPGTQLRIWMPTSALVGCNTGAWTSPISPRIHSTVPGVWAGTQEVSVCECGSPDVRVSPSAFSEEENAIFLSRRLRFTHQVKHATRSVFSGEQSLSSQRLCSAFHFSPNARLQGAGRALFKADALPLPSKLSV